MGAIPPVHLSARRPWFALARAVDVSGKIYVRVEFFHNGQKVNLTSASQAPTPNPNVNTGVVQHTLTMTPSSGTLPTHGVVRVTAWINDPADTFSAPNDLDEDADAWASLNLNRGTVVTLDALPDVGDDKNLLAAKRAKFLLKRTGSTDSALPVKVRLRNHKLDGGANDPRLIKPGTSTSIIAAYGNTQDYHLIPSPWPTNSQTLPYETTVSISSSQSEVVFTVVPKADNLTENNVIVLQALPDPNTGNPAYSVGLQGRAEVLLYDGPEYTLYELFGQQYDPGTEPKAVAVNAGVINAGDWIVSPQVVGSAISPDSYQRRGTLWTAFSGIPSTDFTTNFLPYGISFRASPAAGDRAKVVGAYGTKAWRVLDDGNSGVQLPHLSGTQGPSLAWGISPDGSRSVGYGTFAGKKLPVVWAGTGTPSYLTYNLSGAVYAVGEARAVNDAGVIVGFSSGFGDSISRPFRNQGGGALLGDGDWLTVPVNKDGVPLGNGEGQATAIATYDGKHYAVGSYKDFFNKKAGAYWKGNPLPSSVVDLKRLARNGTFDTEAEALGINSALRIVGWSGPSPTHANRHAVFSANGSAWVDLNDKHFTHGVTDWVLQQANAISDTGVIVGVGTKSGATRGFMLIPRIPGN